MNTATDTIKDFDLTEIIQGEKRMAPSPFGYHQRIVANIFKYIVDLWKTKIRRSISFSARCNFRRRKISSAARFNLSKERKSPSTA